MNPLLQRTIALTLVFGMTMPAPSLIASGHRLNPPSNPASIEVFSSEALSPLAECTPNDLTRKPTVTVIRAAKGLPRKNQDPRNRAIEATPANESRIVSNARLFIDVLAKVLSIDKIADRPRRLKPFLDTYRHQFLLSDFPPYYSSPESFSIRAFSDRRYVGGDPVQVTSADIYRLRVMAEALTHPKVTALTGRHKNEESDLISAACAVLELAQPRPPRLTEGAAPFLREFILTLPETYKKDHEEVFIWFDQWVWENRQEPAQIRSMRQFLGLGVSSDIWTTSQRRWMTDFISIMDREHFPRLDRGSLASTELAEFPSAGQSGLLVPVTSELVGRVYYSPVHRSITLVSASAEDELLGRTKVKPPILTTPFGPLYPVTAWKKTAYGGAYVLYDQKPLRARKFMIGWARDILETIAGKEWTDRNIERVEELLFRLVGQSTLMWFGHHFSLFGDIQGIMVWPALWILANVGQAGAFASLHFGSDWKTGFWNRSEGGLYLGLLWLGYAPKFLWDLGAWLLKMPERIRKNQGFWHGFGRVISSRATRLHQLNNRLINAQGNVSALSLQDRQFARDLTGYEAKLIGQRLWQGTKQALPVDLVARIVSGRFAVPIADEAMRQLLWMVRWGPPHTAGQASLGLQTICNLAESNSRLLEYAQVARVFLESNGAGRKTKLAAREQNHFKIDIPRSHLETLLVFVKTIDPGMLVHYMRVAWARSDRPLKEGRITRAALWVISKRGTMQNFGELLVNTGGQRLISPMRLKTLLLYLFEHVLPNGEKIFQDAQPHRQLACQA